MLLLEMDTWGGNGWLYNYGSDTSSLSFATPQSPSIHFLLIYLRGGKCLQFMSH